ncbi:MAG: Lar family restriction alleviation protein [Hafnia alvei]|uniref:DUF5405 family protein n=1 Tax=Hafnia alvei TaxID=569 RepID=UPI00290E1FAE|nr:DUF5405 family protein [Hafnia alvei]MDU7482459.1 Lar family restriction alleviation protein [Hafnia alvei]
MIHISISREFVITSDSLQLILNQKKIAQKGAKAGDQCLNPIAYFPILNLLIAIESQPKLLPCPFCGSEAHFDSVSAQVMSEERVYAGACTECSCEIMNGPIRNYAGSGWYETKEAAAADWNRRAVVQGGAA